LPLGRLFLLSRAYALCAMGRTYGIAKTEQLQSCYMLYMFLVKI
jgi:hypothetical protein